MSADDPVAPGRPASTVEDDDRQVLARIANGELNALETLYDRYRTMAYSIALRVTGDASLAEDVLQEAFLGAWRHAGRYAEGRGSVKTWLSRSSTTERSTRCAVGARPTPCPRART